MNYRELDTPAMVIDRDIMMDNIRRMQAYADRNQVALRPHTKTHKMPELARLQVQAGARGITVAKVGEAEVMADYGLQDILIANEIVGEEKFRRIRRLMDRGVKVSFGMDSIPQADLIEKGFADSDKPAQVLVEIEVGENRSGVIEPDDFEALLTHVKHACPHIAFRGIFSHDGNSYHAKDLEECREIHLASQRRTLEFAQLAKNLGMEPEVVSIGSTPSLLQDFPILPGVTELRPGTYILMDASQANVIGNQSQCAATVLATVISRPTDERVILDVGAKGITMQSRKTGICSAAGMGLIRDFPGTWIDDVYDEHAIIYSKDMHDRVQVGDKVEIIPVHICPVMNLHEQAYLVSGGQVVDCLPIRCRGKLR